jgi:pimeloyl-ACP methyl ester carboxylesterase
MTKSITLSSGIQISFLDEGVGPRVVLMLHGMGSNKLAWNKFIHGLQGRFRCIAPDLPNYGDSSAGDYPFTMSFFAGVMWELLEKLGVSQVYLCGHSMGGQIALIMALQRPFAVEKMALFATAGFEVFQPHEKMILNGFYAAPNMLALSREQIRQNFNANFYEFPADAEFMVQDRFQLQQTPRYEGYCRMIPKCVNGMLEEPVFDFLPSVNVPAIIFFGKEDQLIPNRIVHPGQTAAQIARQGVRRMPMAKLHLVDKCGHFPHWERAEEVGARVKEFFG